MTANPLLIPPAPDVPAADLPSWRVLRMMSRNSLRPGPHAAFDERIVRRRLLGVDVLLVNDGDGVRHVLATGAACYERFRAARRVVRSLTGLGLLLSEGAEWRRQRRSLAPV